MHRFYVDLSNIFEEEIIIDGTDVNHIKNVLRLTKGEEIVICDGQGRDYYCIINDVAQSEVRANIKEIKSANTELKTKIYLFQGLPKKDKMELIVQKAVELGVYEIIPVKMNRSIVKIENEKKELNRINRWQTIANEASKQSRRGILPRVSRILDFKQAVEKAKELECVILPYELAEDMSYTKKVLEEVCKSKSIGVFIGPEGGFEENEVNEVKNIGGKAITLGRRILRTETAGLATMAMLMYNIE